MYSIKLLRIKKILHLSRASSLFASRTLRKTDAMLFCDASGSCVYTFSNSSTARVLSPLQRIEVCYVNVCLKSEAKLNLTLGTLTSQTDPFTVSERDRSLFYIYEQK